MQRRFASCCFMSCASVCIYTCIYEYTCVQVYVHIHMYICIGMYAYSTYMHIRLYTDMQLRFVFGYFM